MLKTLTDARQFTHNYQYDDSGRLVRDDDPAGEFTALTRTLTDDGYQVGASTGLNAPRAFGSSA